MGESRINDLSAKAIAFSKGKMCVFCGGGTEATTVDHYPPKGMFEDKKWPEGYVFPACLKCNSGSKEDESLVALLARFNHGNNDEPELPLKTRKMIDHLKRNRPALHQKMRSVPASTKRSFAKRVGWKLGENETYAQLPLVTVPKEFDQAVQTVATKLAKALHFEHTGKIVPADAGMFCRWYTNVNQFEGHIPEELFSNLTNKPELKRGKVQLNDQFSYVFQMSDDGKAGMYTAWFRFSFCIHVSIVFDAEIFRETLEAAKCDADKIKAEQKNGSAA